MEELTRQMRQMQTVIERQQQQLEQQQQLFNERAQQQQQRPRNIIIPKFYTAKEDDDWKHWRTHFTMAAQVNNYPDLEARMVCRSCMTGRAASAIADIQVDGMDTTLEHILNAYEARFMPAAASDLARIRFDSALQASDESELQWHGRLRELFNQAYPDNMDATMLIRCFMYGLKSARVPEHAMRQRPQNYEDALQAAQGEQSLIEVGKLTNLGDNSAEGMDINAVEKDSTCHFCEKKGHFKANCYLWKKAKQGLQQRSEMKSRPNTKDFNPRNREQRQTSYTKGNGKKNPQQQQRFKKVIAALAEAMANDDDDDNEDQPEDHDQGEETDDENTQEEQDF